jgi:hypothetical protein
MYGIFSREFTKYTIIYGVNIRFWPTLLIPQSKQLAGPESNPFYNIYWLARRYNPFNHKHKSPKHGLITYLKFS